VGTLGIVAAIAGAALAGEDSIANALGFIVFILALTVGLPSAIGVAVLRYRLWELDVVVKRTVVALVLTLAFGVPVLAVLASSSQLLVWGVPNPVWTLIGGVGLGLLVVPIVRVARRFATRIAFGAAHRYGSVGVRRARGRRPARSRTSFADGQVLANATGATSLVRHASDYAP
jgi:hypothetical protein